MELYSSIRYLKGIGDKTEKMFNKLGVYSCLDMLLYFPRAFAEYPDIVNPIDITVNKVFAVKGRIVGRPVLKKTARMDIVLAKMTDGLNEFSLTFFRQGYLAKTLNTSQEFIFYGKVYAKGQFFQMDQPRVFTVEKYREMQTSMQPVYPLTTGLKNQTVVKGVEAALSEGLYPEEIIPGYIMEEYDFPPAKTAVRDMHFPISANDYLKAKSKFAYEEFLLFVLGIKYQKMSLEKTPNNFCIENTDEMETVKNNLGFELTPSQKDALFDILSDVSGKSCMQRLLQGDVGSGKTIVAFLSMIVFAQNGYKSALMAPTEVLAVQHYEAMTKLINKNKLNYEVLLLTGSVKEKDKKIIREKLKGDAPLFVIGTHALIQEKVEYSNLGLVITDEQHRFGVNQRDAFSNKGLHPHVLVMSATPIPRTLSIILYGDLDISVMEGMPAKRLPIKNAVVKEKSHPACYKKILEQLNMGHQAYVICPLAEESEDINAKDVISYCEELRNIFPKTIRIEYLHGKMKSDKKQEIMDDFSSNKIKILVSTTVIEVGIDVANATIIMIENAERFGLAQLHQLRGRVGRSDKQSYCILVNGSDKDEASERLEILNGSNDGFYIAEQDLKLRGPGEYFGYRQSGDVSFKIGDIYEDQMMLKKAARDAARIIEKDPELSLPENAAISARVLSYMKERAQSTGI
ncbi:MAG: ATP-dependent DNA helicase RecG [Eubacterium sp.]|nr:ATP-dependent DNA helicase RecG [Eubacterium sp.]